jgi:alpha-tubulin suppressor-like RCC1 family protein
MVHVFRFTARVRPGQVGTAHDWIAFSLGTAQRCGIRANASDLATVWCWGGNHNGQVGDGTTDDVPSPKQIGDAAHWTTISAGGGTTHALQYQPAD